MLVTNTRDFVLVGEDAAGRPTKLETFRLADDADTFVRRLATPRAFAREVGAGLGEYLIRALSHRAALAEPKDLAWLLASYARDGLARRGSFIRRWCKRCSMASSPPGCSGRARTPPPVVGEYSPNSDAETTVVVGGYGEKGGRTGGGFVRVELREGDAGVVVDTDVDVFPSGALCALSSVVGHPVTGPVEAAEFLDVEMQQVARVRVFIAADGRRRIEGAEAGNPLAAKHPTDGGGRDPDGGRNLRAGPAETAQRNDLDGDSRRQRPADTVWARTAVAQAVGALGLVAGPPTCAPCGHKPRRRRPPQPATGPRRGPAGQFRLDSAESTWHSDGCSLGPPSGKLCC